MRALAVIAVMVYHADNAWLPGGFIGVEVFFVISGYLITLLLIGEHESTGTISFRAFWARRGRRLLPALYLMLSLLVIYTAIFKSDVLGQLRGDVMAALTYVSNWYQILVGQSYTSSGDFAPLRHVWSLAVEEQFYLVWPLIMAWLLRRDRVRVPNLSRWFLLVAVAISVATTLLYYPGPQVSPTETPDAYWHVFGRAISKTDTLYLSTFTRVTGLLVGAALATLWRPRAVSRGPLRNKGRALDGLAVIGLVALGLLAWNLHIITPDGADAGLFRGGFLAVDLATVLMIVAVTHRHAWTGRLLGIRPLRWVGTRSYGLYLYHWVIYQIIRKVAGNTLTVEQFVVAIVVSGLLAEVSYQLVEMPVRRRHVGLVWARIKRTRDPLMHRIIAFGAASVIAALALAGVSMATARLQPNEIARSLDENAGGPGLLDISTSSTSTSTSVPASAVAGGREPSSAAHPVVATTSEPPASSEPVASTCEPPASSEPVATTCEPSASSEPASTSSRRRASRRRVEPVASTSEPSASSEPAVDRACDVDGAGVGVDRAAAPTRRRRRPSHRPRRRSRPSRRPRRDGVDGAAARDDGVDRAGARDDGADRAETTESTEPLRTTESTEPPPGRRSRPSRRRSRPSHRSELTESALPRPTNTTSSSTTLPATTTSTTTTSPTTTSTTTSTTTTSTTTTSTTTTSTTHRRSTTTTSTTIHPRRPRHPRPPPRRRPQPPSRARRRRCRTRATCRRSVTR